MSLELRSIDLSKQRNRKEKFFNVGNMVADPRSVKSSRNASESGDIMHLVH